MKKITLILLFSMSCFGQNAYRDAHLLSEKGSAGILKRIQNIQSTEVFQNYPQKGEIDNFEIFLNTPFAESLTHIDVKESLGYISEVEMLILADQRLNEGKKKDEIVDLFGDQDGDGVADSIDKCPDTAGPASNQGCPEALKAAEALKGQSITTILVKELSDFLVERVKAELTITFYDNFRTRLKETLIIPLVIEGDTINVEVKLRLLFPETFLLLESAGEFDTPSLGKTWVTAFKKDLIYLPSKLELVLKDSNNKDLAKTQIGSFTLMSFEAVNRIKKGEHPMNIIKSMNNLYNKDQKYENELRKVLALLQLISSNLTYQEQDGEKLINRWATAEDLDLLDQSSKRYMTALIYQQGVENKLFEVIKMNDIPLKNKIQENYLEFYLYIEQMGLNFRTVAEMLETVKQDAVTPDTAKALEDYAFYLTSFYNLFDQTMQASYSLFGSEEYYNSFYVTDVKPVVDNIIGINNALAQKNYAECILLSANLMENLLYKHLNKADPKGNKDMLKSFMFYSNFLADIIAASESKDSGNVKKIIENYAMPVGSYRIKRSYSHSWDVSAFPGLYGGYEFGSGKKDGKHNEGSFSYGITAPVGISFSRKHCRHNPSSSSSTFFLSVIDIGAPFSYRFSNDQAQGLPDEIKWEQIFSPGFFYIFGFKNTPLSLSAGLQFTPLLRDIEDDNNVLQEKNIVRLSVGFLVDIPIFNLKKGSLN